MLTIGEAEQRFGLEVLDHLDRQVSVPVLSGLQFQGDIAVIPAPARVPASTPLPAGGYTVARGVPGGNTHRLIADTESQVSYDPAANTRGLLLGVLTVTHGTAYLAHPEHAFSGIAPGTYELRRQRKQADAIRLVAD